MDNFHANRYLLNPKFEGYRLDLVPQEQAISRFALQNIPSQTTAPGNVPLSFQEVQSRITHNHLAVSTDGSRAIYVDAEYRVVLIDFVADLLNPSLRVVHELPRPVQTSSAHTLQREYSSAAFLNETTVLIADGYGSMYVFVIKEGGASDAIGVFTLPAEATDTPFRIHHAYRTSPTTAVAVLSSRYYPPDPPPRVHGKHIPINFDIWAAKIDLLSLRTSSRSRELDILWHRRGQDVPISASYIPALKAHLLIGGTNYPGLDISTEHYQEPTPDELAPIPRANENLHTDMKIDGPPKPPPYSWTQTSDSITIAFPLPSNTSKTKIKVTFSPQTLTLHVDNDAETSVHIPRYSAKTLWDGIAPSSSFWTWDREAEHAYGLLTLHLEKKNEGTRWTHVFSSISTGPSFEASPNDIEVPETLDPSELWLIRENLEKYTAALRSGEDASGLGLGVGVPRLAEGEMDADVDSSVGRTSYLTWVGADGSTPSWWKNGQEIPFQLLSTTIPGKYNPEITLIVKNNVDGTVFTLDPSPSIGGPPEWIHTTTFSALAFVLASKRDTRFTYHIPDQAVFAFEGGVRDRGGNVYIYRASPVTEKWAKQAVLKVDDGRGGSLLGVGKITSPDGRTVVACLTEGELVLIKEI
ncbi:hypothetical protein BDQ12DRAFT_679638 [Crucibulum laeve]|uniref:NudC domain-containing protein 1 n=1 Tax=Crucibulum laeve TaxID=68775 RepID=A0A5C3M798_9AGAR|nr:hypothetical protein BDQ12DRAFT_679638 [Crucibulum laeve]